MKKSNKSSKAIIERTSDDGSGTNRSLFQKIKETAKYLKSPLFTVQVILFVIGNCTVSLSLNVVNDLMCRDTGGDTIQFNKIQKEFEIVRSVLATMSCFFMGLATDFSMKFWNKTSSRNKDVQKTLLRIGATGVEHPTFERQAFLSPDLQ